MHLARGRCWVLAGGLAVLTAVVYLPGLERSPLYPTSDEVRIALAAHSIAESGFDRTGRWFPLYFQMSPITWFQPVAVYAEAASFRLFGFSTFAMRLPTVCIGIANVVLIGCVSAHWFRRRWLGVFAGIALMMAPGHFIHSRLGMDYLYPVPFMLGWLLCLSVYMDTKRLTALLTGCLLLGLGFYTYIGAVIWMPAFFAVTAGILLASGYPRRHVLGALAAFALPLCPAGAWLVAHPSALADTIRRYALAGAPRGHGPIGDMLSNVADTVVARSPQYWDYFNPAYLFVDLPAPLLFTQRGFGALLLGIAPLWFGGLYRLACAELSWRSGLLFASVALVPLGTLLVGERIAIQRALPVLALVVILAAGGMGYLWRLRTTNGVRPLAIVVAALAFVMLSTYAQRRELAATAILLHNLGPIGDGLQLLASGIGLPIRPSWIEAARPSPLSPLWAMGLLGIVLWTIGSARGRRSAWLVLVLICLATLPTGFASFRQQYFTHYRDRSGELVVENLPEALDQLIDFDNTEPVPAVLLSAGIPEVEDYWRFELLRQGKESLLRKTAVVTAVEVATMPMPTGTLLLARADSEGMYATMRALTVAHEIRASGSDRVTYTIYRR